MVRLKGLPPQDRPREKMMQEGPQTLSNAELMAIVLGKGGPGKDVLHLAQEVVEGLNGICEEPSWEKLCQIAGIGPAKACQILASVEFSRRFLTSKQRLRISTPKDALPALATLKASPQEAFAVLTLDAGNQLIKCHMVTVGLVNQSQIHPREAFHCAVADRAVGIIVAHNHPSGRLLPSDADLQVTRRLAQVGQTLGIPVLDHLIVTAGGVLSLRESHSHYFI